MLARSATQDGRRNLYTTNSLKSHSQRASVEWMNDRLEFADKRRGAARLRRRALPCVRSSLPPCFLGFLIGTHVETKSSASHRKQRIGCRSNRYKFGGVLSAVRTSAAQERRQECLRHEFPSYASSASNCSTHPAEQISPQLIENTHLAPQLLDTLFEVPTFKLPISSLAFPASPRQGRASKIGYDGAGNFPTISRHTRRLD
jgi:hypothetical protein